LSISREITLTTARRLAIQKQRLAGPPITGDRLPTTEDILDVIRDIGCLQLDPISVVERTHLLVLCSRLGKYHLAEFDKVMWKERCLFEYWAHCASIVLTEDYPIHNLMMRRYAKGESAWPQRLRAWVEANKELHDEILALVQERGPIMSKDFEDRAYAGWHSTGWTSGRNVSQMLDYFWMSGQMMVSGRRGLQKQWDLSERVLPHWTPREELSEEEAVRRAVQKSLRALGVARPEEIKQHYIRGRYPGLKGVLDELEREGLVERVRVTCEDGKPLPGQWHLHSEDVPLLERMENGEWQGRTTLLSPFDNLICDRKRTEGLFNFRFRIEIYTPPAKREYGYYVLPILHDDRLIGRIDPRMDRKAQRLHVNAVHAEPDAPQDAKTAHSVAGAISELADFLGAREVVYSERVPESWQSAFA
jgi:uncharacterized protein YcaQ